MVLEVARVVTPVTAPAVVTFKPPLEVKAKVPVALPIATVPVPVVAMVTFEAPAVAKLVTPLEERVVKEPVLPEMGPEILAKVAAPNPVTDH